jgi:hypothetical protein
LLPAAALLGRLLCGAACSGNIEAAVGVGGGDAGGRPDAIGAADTSTDRGALERQ